MTILGKFWYWIISFIYILFLAGLGAYAVNELIHACMPKLDTSDTLFLAIVISIAVFFFTFQYFRIIWSRQRTDGSEKSQLVASFWSVHTNFSLLCVLGLFCIQTLAMFIHFVVGE